MKKPKTILLAALIVFIAIGFAGRCDYNETVIYNMPDATYQAVKTTLGDDCTDTELVDEYQSNKAYWDSIIADCIGCVYK